MKKLLILMLVLALLLSVAGCGGVQQSEYDALKSELDAVTAERDAANSEIEALGQTVSALTGEIEEKESVISGLEAEIQEFDEMRKKYKDLSDAELLAQTEANNLKAEEDRLETERILAEEKAAQEREEAEKAAALEAEKKLGYETGITYDNLARNPSDYEGKKVKFYGRVLQVMEGTGAVSIRLATSGYYDNVVYAYYDSTIVTSRVLEDDFITIYGVSMGLYSYTATSGATITIPSILVDKIDQ